MKNTFEIAICPWGGEYRPKAGGTVEIIPEKGIQVTLYCEETEIRAVNETPDSPVWQDSCLECFIRYYPDDERYINFEVNANGCMLSEIGKDRNRTYLRDMGLELPEVEAIRTEKGWQIRYLVTYELVKKAYPCGTRRMPPVHRKSLPSYPLQYLRKPPHIHATKPP